MTNVLFIENHACVIGQGAPARDLPQPRDTGSGGQIVGKTLPVFAYLFSDDGPRPNKTHLSHEDIENLGNLVEAGLPKYSSDRSNSRVVAQLAVFCHSTRA